MPETNYVTTHPGLDFQKRPSVPDSCELLYAAASFPWWPEAAILSNTAETD
jgi:hypothetical protein